MNRNTGNSNLLATLLLTVFATLLLALVGWLLPPPTIAIAIGNEAGLNAYGQGENLYNFFGWGNPGTEKGKQARRIEPVASLMIPSARRLGSPLTLEVTMCGCGSTAPVTLTLNQQQHRVELSNEWKSYQFSLANAFAPPSSPTDEMFPIVYKRSLYIEWRSDAAVRPLVHRVVLQAEAPDGYPAGSVLAGLFIGVVLLLGDRGQGTGNRGRGAGDSLWVGMLLASAGVARWLYPPHLLPWLAVVALGGFAAVLLTLFCSDLRHRLLLWGLAVWLLAAPFVSGTWILDDAFISFRYARNLVEGAGLTFNPGGEIVEGYTNFLWTMIIAGGLAVGFEPVLMAHVLCTGLSLATLVLVYRFAVAWWGGAWSLLPPLLLAITPSFLLYTARSSGMETALVTFLATGALWLLWRAHDGRSGLLAGVACALVTMTRPDGVLVFGAGVLARVIPLFSQCGKKTAQNEQDVPENEAISPSLDPQPPNPEPRTLNPEPSPPNPWPLLLAIVGGFVLLYVPYFFARWSYYGYLLPNTFYAKTGATMAQVMRGFAYSSSFVMSMGLRSVVVLGGLSLLALALSPLRRRVAPGPALLLWLFVLLTGLYVTLVGGDHFPLWRFFVPIVPAVVLLATHGLASAWGIGQLIRGWLRGVALPARTPAPALVRGLLLRLAWLPVGVAGLALLLSVVFGLMTISSLDSRDIRGRVWGEYYVALKNREIGLWLRMNTPSDTVVATGIAGALPYYAHRHVIDALGLNNLHIAHLSVETIGQGVAGAEKTDPIYILNQRPDYIPHATSGAFEHLERFHQEYERIAIRGPEGGEILLYRRKEP